MTKIVVTSTAYKKGKKKYTRVTVPLHILSAPALKVWELRIGRKTARNVQKTASEFGTNVHDLCSKIAKGESPKIPKKYQRQIDKFNRWLDKKVTTVLFSEETFFNDELMIAGTVDLGVILVDGNKAIADIKTGRIHASAILQLGAYSMLSGINNGILLPLSRNKLTKKIISVGELTQPATIYVSVLEVYRWLHEQTKKKK